MKKISIILVSFFFYTVAFAAEFAVIAHSASSVKNLTPGEIKNLYLFEKLELGGAGLKLADNKGNDVVLKGFVKKIMGMDVSDYDRKRVEITYAKGRSTKALASDSDVIAFVKERSGNIGYVSKAAVTGDVVTLFSGSTD